MELRCEKEGTACRSGPNVDKSRKIERMSQMIYFMAIIL